MLPPSDETNRTTTLQGRSLLKSLEQARNKLELSKESWAKLYLRVSEQDYDDILARKQDFSALSLFHLTEKLWINPSDFESGRIDYDALIRVQSGQTGFIHPRYTAAAKSRKHTVLNSLNFVQKHRGLHLRNSVNRHFQIRDDFWSKDLMEPINIRFMGDLFSFLRAQGFSDADFRSIGVNSANTLRDTEVGKAFSRCTTTAELFELLVEALMSRFEENCLYRISHLSEEQCVLESVSNPEVADALNTRQTGTIETCLVRVGIFSGLPTYIGLPQATVHETHCVHRGDVRCRFLIDYSFRRLRDNGIRLTAIS